MKTFFKKIIVFIITIEAKLVLKKYKPKIIAITGSVGKTSSKDAIFSILSSHFSVRKSEKSFNGDIGVPLTILGLPNGWNNLGIWFQNILRGLEIIFFKSNYPKYLVLEVGADRPGDIKNIAKWIRPDIAVYSKVSKVPVHVEYFKSPENVYEEKAYLAKYLKENGTLILPEDDSYTKSIISFKKESHKVITYGFENTSMVNGSNEHFLFDEESHFPLGMTLKLRYNNVSLPAKIFGSFGRQFLYPLLSGVSVALSLGLTLDQVIDGITKHTPSRGRMNIIKGKSNSIIIDDTYNSSPDALFESLSTLKKLGKSYAFVGKNKKKIAILGDMLELGKFSVDEHIKAGEWASKCADILITVGLRAERMKDGALKGGMNRMDIMSFQDSLSALDKISQMDLTDSIILVKGSQGIRMERIVRVIMERPEEAQNTLVRQEEEWLAKK